MYEDYLKDLKNDITKTSDPKLTEIIKDKNYKELSTLLKDGIKDYLKSYQVLLNDLIDYLGFVPNYIWNILLVLVIIFIVLALAKRSESQDIKLLKEEIEKLKLEISDLRKKNWKDF